jgi:hypothetical protein
VIVLPVLYFVLFIWSLDRPMTKEKVQHKVQTIQCPKKKYKIKYRRSNDQIKRTKQSTGNTITKEKVQNKVQTIQWPWSLDRLYFILYFFFGDCIACTLFCPFYLVIRSPVLYFVLFLW